MNNFNAYLIKTTIKLDGMDNLKELLNKQQELLDELYSNVAEIESVVRKINLELSMEKATQ